MGTTKELRVHGVGGSPGPRLLGLSDPDTIDVVAEGVGTAFWTRRRDRNIEGYDWGSLTSGSALQPLWVLLLPFTLLNVAGWMHPPDSPRQTKVIRALVHVLSVLMTLSWVLWLAIIFVDLLGYQWMGRVAEHPFVAELQLGGWRMGDWLTEPGAPIQPLQWIGAGLGLCVVGAVMAGIIRIAGNTQKAFEATVAPGTSNEERWLPHEDLGSASFFARPDAAARLLAAHKVAVGIGFLLVIARFGWQTAADAAVIDFGHLLLACAAVEFVLVGSLAVASWRTGAPGFLDRLRCGPAMAAIFGFFFANAMFSGAILFVVKRFSTFPGLDGAAQDPTRLVAGPELALTDAWLPLIALAIAILTIWILGGQRMGSADDLPARRSPPGRQLDGVEETWRHKVKKARGLALVARKSPWAAAVLALTFFVITLVLSLSRIEMHGSLSPFDWTRDVRVEDSFLWGAASWVLGGLPLILMAIMRAAVRSESARRKIGILWDVLTFWPRRFHPLSVRPYSERAVVELRGRIRFHLEQGDPVMVSAHSQGTVLAFAALSTLEEAELNRVAFVSYGSPISTLYSQTFPAYFGPEDLTRLTSTLMGGEHSGWKNFHRDTDPIGGPVFPEGSDRDHKLTDPAITASMPEGDDPDDVEPDRLAWVELAGHSHYLREPELKQWVRDVKALLNTSKFVLEGSDGDIPSPAGRELSSH